MNPVAVLAAVAIGGGCAAAAGIAFPPTRRLADRVRPYTIVARTGLGHAPDVSVRRPTGGTVGGVFGPPLCAMVGRMSRQVEHRGDDHLALLLRQAGLADLGA